MTISFQHEDITVYDDWLDPNTIQFIENVVVHNHTVDWTFLNNSSNVHIVDPDPMVRNFPGFECLVALNNFPKDGHLYAMQPLLNEIRRTTNKPVNNILRFRFYMSLPYPNYKEYYSSAHVDLPVPHTTAIYYITDADGDTIFFNKWYNDSTPHYTEKNKDIAARISPKKGRLVVFNGARFHSGSGSTTGVRAILNINFN